MSEQIRQLVDLNEQALSQVRFGRNRFLRAAGAALFGLAIRMVAPRPLYAHPNNASPPPYPCVAFHPCPACSGTTCAVSGCTWHGWHSHGCSSGQQCWYTCAVEGYIYKCCDWHHPTLGWQDLCICSAWVGFC